ncbi:MAG: hypothetical protein U0264_15080 [Candidatus Kapaibacterium sp.]
MGKIFFLAVVLLITSASHPSSVFAQTDAIPKGGFSSPLDPEENTRPLYIGGLVGFGPTVESGEFLTDKCDCPAFKDGSGINVIFGGLIDYGISSKMSIGATLVYDYRTLNAGYSEVETVELRKQGSSEIMKIPVAFHHTTTSTFSFITAQPFFNMYIIRRFFVRGGIGLSFAVGSSLLHEKELTQTEATLPDGEQVSLSIDRDKYPNSVSDTKAIIQDTEFPKLSGVLLSGTLSTGVEIKAGKKMTITPLLQFGIPLTDLSSSGTNFRLRSTMFFLEVRYNLE